jgi:hypothetical protein
MPLTTKPQNITETAGLEADAPIAPQEIRELIARLTEQSVEAVPAHEARTLEGLALETGISVNQLRDGLADLRKPKRFIVPPAAIAAFVALVGVGYWAIVHTPPVDARAPAAESVTAPPVQVPVPVTPDTSGTVPLTNVTFGPDSGNYSVDTGFEPSTPLPEGVSINAQASTIMWGSGDHRAAAFDKPLSPDQEAAVRKAMEELLQYVRADAPRRHVGTPKPGTVTPGAPGGTFAVQIGGMTYHGAYGGSVDLPPPGKEYDAAAARAISKAAKLFVEAMQEQLRQSGRWRRENGP